MILLQQRTRHKALRITSIGNSPPPLKVMVKLWSLRILYLGMAYHCLVITIYHHPSLLAARLYPHSPAFYQLSSLAMWN
jgi:hypothetical protein